VPHDMGKWLNGWKEWDLSQIMSSYDRVTVLVAKGANNHLDRGDFWGVRFNREDLVMQE